MDQKTDGIYRLTQISSLYNVYQRMLGAERARRTLVCDYIRPFADARVLDLGCGPAAILPYLGPVHYVGIDANAAHVEQAQRVFAGLGQFIAGDFSRATEQGVGFDIVLCLGLLHHLDDHAVRALAKLGSSCLKPGGRLIAVDPAFVDGQNPVARFLAAKDSGQNVRTPDGYGSLLGTSFGDIDTHVRSDLLIVPYTHCITTAVAATT